MECDCVSYPILYKSNETDFSHLGLGVLSDCVDGFVAEERNGIFEMEFEYPFFSPLFKELKNDRLIKVDAGHLLKDQRFRIVKITKPAKGICTIYAEHISYLTEGMQLQPNVKFSGDASSALNIWKNNLISPHPFTVYSDISTTGSGEWSITDVDNAREALGGTQGSMLDTYGGEYRFDNYHIGLYKNRGSDNGLLIAYGKNLIDLEQEEEIANTYTSIYPFVTIDNDGKEEILTLPEKYIDSEHTSKYARRRIQKVNFSNEEITTVAQLRNRTNQYIKQNNIGVPKVNLKVSFVDLSQTLDYKDIALVERINLCDLVTVYFDKLDIYVKAKVIKTKWNFLLDRYEEIEIGEPRFSLSDSVNTIVDGKVEEVDDKITVVQIAANGKNRIFRGIDKPTQGMSKNDLWYKPVGDGETEMYRYDGVDWRLEKVSAGLLQGRLDAENGDVDLINVNVSTLVGNRSEFVKSWWNAINSRATIDGNELRFTHTDGSYTSMRADGFKRFIAGSGREYHSLIYMVGYVLGGQSVRWAQLPNEFKGKPFTPYIVIADSLQAQNNGQSINRFVVTGHPNYQNDYTNARVPLIGYKLLTDGTNIVTSDVQGLLIVVY